jgi:GDP-L-fucose synthase
MKIFITGGHGYLGQNLIPELEHRGHSIVAPTSSEINLRISGSLNQIDDMFDQIWHLAAYTQAGDFCLRHPGKLWLYNQQLNTNVLDWWRIRQPQAKLIAIGTSCAYPSDVPLLEENYFVGLPHESLISYGLTKRMMLVGLQSLAKELGLKYLCLIPSTLFGPGYYAGGKQLHFIFDLMRKIIRGKMHGEPVILWGDGYQKRELIFTPDFVAAAIELAVTHDNDLVNVGGAKEHSIRWYAEVLSNIVGYDVSRIEYDTSKYVGVRSKEMRIEKLRRLLPDFRHTPLETALERTTRWFAKSLEESMYL